METPAHRLYSPGQIALAAFLGSPLAASWLWSRNYHRLGQPKSASQCLVWGIVGTAAMFVLAVVLPEDLPSQAIPIGYTAGLLQGAKQIHGAVVTEHLAAGGRLGSWWGVVGIGLVGLVVVAAVIFGIFLLLPIEL